MRTLVISDLHLGQRPGHDVLRRPAALRALLRALAEIDRLVLLGDVVELGSRLHRRRPMQSAAPVLRAIGSEMGPEREIVLVPGNHDAVLVRDWVRDRGASLGLADPVPLDATPALAAVTGLLAPARVTVSYPGVWLREDVWATHGHYLDRHLVPVSTFGLPRRGLARPGTPATPADYERARRRRRRRQHEQREHTWLERLRERPLGMLLEGLAELGRHGGGVLRQAHLTRLTAAALDLQVRHGAVPALAHVTGRLEVGAEWVLFGHVHRAGPLDGVAWRPWPRAPALLNTGSWCHEPLLVEGSSPANPYWPGGAIVIDGAQPPRALRLLDDVPARELAAPRG